MFLITYAGYLTIYSPTLTPDISVTSKEIHLYLRSIPKQEVPPFNQERIF